MRITFGQDATSKENMDLLQTRPGEAGIKTAQQKTAYANPAGVYKKDSAPFFLQEGKSKVAKGLEKAGQMSVDDLQNQQNYMTLMSNTLSEEDYAKLQEEGYEPSKMDPKDTVTIVDKIKAELARSGQEIVGFTDDLDIETLQKALGGDLGLAQELVKELGQADIPVGNTMIAKLQSAWDMAQSIGVPGDGTLRYMVDNELEPEIYDFYMAKSSGAEGATPGNAKYIAQDVNGYFSQASTDLAGLEEQLDKVIVEANLEVNPETKEEVQWLSKEGLPITANNLQMYHELKSIEFPITKENFTKSVRAALEEGKAPIHANLVETESIFQKANKILDRYLQVEEVRLEMTAEVNVKLLKQGFSFDTASIEEVVEQIKQAKEELAKDYFPTSKDPVSDYAVYEKTNQIVQDLPELPAVTLGRQITVPEQAPSLEEFHAQGAQLAKQFKDAGESYETLMTAPRADMGDSIRKAFSNVDDILVDLKLDTSDENRQAIRILGYNRMELTVENVETIKAACATVSSVVEKMTPASTLQMIRDGVNPLEKSFAELEQYFRAQERTYEKESESYSKYLYALEQKNQITDAERESYIGIFRMLRMIEKGDQASVGAIVNMQAELDFANLLSATRTAKVKHMDVKLTEDFGALKELQEKGTSISTQIDTAFLAKLQADLNEAVVGEEETESYNDYMYRSVRETYATETENLAFLEKAEMPATVENLQAAGELSDLIGAPFKKLRRERQDDRLPADLTQKLADKEAFVKEYAESIEEAKQVVEELTMEADKFVDVKSMQLAHKQLTILGSLVAKEEYMLPMELNGEVQTVHLTIEAGTEDRGMVDISISLEEGSLQAHLEVGTEKVSGYLVGISENEVMISRKCADIFSEWIKEDTSWSMDAKLPVVSSQMKKSAKKLVAGDTKDKEEIDNKALYQVAKGLLSAVKTAMEA